MGEFREDSARPEPAGEKPDENRPPGVTPDAPGTPPSEGAAPRERGRLPAPQAPFQPAGGLRRWMIATWFLLGVLIGGLGIGLATRLTSPGAGPDLLALRQAAREGLMEAIATLQAGGPAQPSGNQSATPAPKEFKIREANRLGKKDAPVTIVEFSDFQ